MSEKRRSGALFAGRACLTRVMPSIFVHLDTKTLPRNDSHTILRVYSRKYTGGRPQCTANPPRRRRFRRKMRYVCVYWILSGRGLTGTRPTPITQQ